MTEATGTHLPKVEMRKAAHCTHRAAPSPRLCAPSAAALSNISGHCSAERQSVRVERTDECHLALARATRRTVRELDRHPATPYVAPSIEHARDAHERIRVDQLDGPEI